jgi:hypothetical protein
MPAAAAIQLIRSKELPLMVPKIGLMIAWFVVGTATFIVELRADSIQYSWSGTVFQRGGDDPWLIGSQGKPFEISATVRTNAMDAFPPEAYIADFWTDDVQLTLDGQSLTYVGNGLIDFVDNAGGTDDLITISGIFTNLGQSLAFGSGVSLPGSTFLFTQNLETPPTFSPTLSTGETGCCGGTYDAIVSAGSLVEALPEPNSATLLVMCGIISGTASRIGKRSGRRKGLENRSGGQASFSFPVPE